MRLFLFLFVTCFALVTKAQNQSADTGRIKNIKLHKKGNDHADLAFEFEISRTKDPLTGRVPREVLAEANRRAMQSQKDRRNAASRTSSLSWIERGSNSDAVGPSNGNTRANGAVTSGRMRAIWADLSDATGNTVWVGGVDGGIWKTTNISASPASWTVMNDYLSNLAVTGICQDPTNTSIMYFCTGESFFNSDAVNGNGVYKSTDGGLNWTQLSSTTSYTACSKILCDASGNVYLATIGNGMKRSTNGGSTWTDITPTGLSNRIADFEISSTGRMHISCGLHTTTNGYRYTNSPSSVTASTWTSATTPFVFPSGNNSRVEMACAGNVLYAALSNTNAIVDSVTKSLDGGVTWTTTALPTTAKQDLNGTNSSSQAWYCLTVGINPANGGACMIGNLNIIKTSDTGKTWVKGSEWVGTSGQYVHADQHAIIWYDNGNKLLFGSDGGVHFSADQGATIRDRNVNLRIKQFYSVAIHPSTTNYFLAGAQDNGVHQFSTAGLGATVEVTGGDGANVAIDQDQPQYQFGAYVYNAYRRSTNSGSSWGSVNFYKGTSAASSNFGSFINPYVYDNSANVIYAAAGGGEIFRWTTPQTTLTGNYYQTDGFPSGATILTGITNLNSETVTALKVSPFTANRVYFGTSSGRLIYIDNANTAASSTAGTSIRSASFSGSISSINTGTNEQNLIVSFSNYNVFNVWVSSNGGTSWTAIDGNLPNMPVRWAMFYPNDNTKAIIATEAGIWETDLINGSSTVWTANPTFPVVRTDMLQYRSSDGLLAAATHGRGLWTTIASACPTTPNVTVTPSSATYCSPSGTAVSLTASGGLTYTWSPSSGLSASTGATVSANPTATTVYTITGTDVNGCSATATATLNVAPSVSVTASATPSSVCSGGNSILTAVPSVASSTYCQPTYANGTGAGDFIAQVSVATTTLSNTTTGAASPYYTLFPASGSTTGTFTANTLYTMTVKGGTFSSCYIRGWIDYNADGVFDPLETIGISSNVGNSVTGTFQFTIPITAFNGTTRLRLRSSDTSPGPGTGDVCGATNSNWGETEDYTITISGGANQFTYAWSPSTFLSSTTTNPVTASAITGNITYTVVATSAGCSASAQTTVSLISVTTPTGTNGSRCGTGTVALSATPAAGNTVDWYAASTGGTALLSGNNSYTTPSISSTTIYYAEARNTTFGCVSATRTAVTATVNALPLSPTGTNGSRCGTGTVALSATPAAGNTVDWYAASTGGTALLAGNNSYTTPSISSTTIYYAEAKNTTSGCVSATRTAVTATVNSNPATPIISANGPLTFCSGNSVTLTSSSAGNNAWSTGATTQSIVVSTSGNYSVAVSNASGCTSTSLPTTVTVNACSMTLNLKLFLEGYYTGPSNMATPLYDLGISTDPSASDTIMVDLWPATGLGNSAPAFTQKIVVLKNGTATAMFAGTTVGNSYYIAIRHRNHLETWSASPVLMSSTTTYDFSTGLNKAYNDGFNPPMKNIGNVFAFYGGDVNNDGTVDALDLSALENDASNFFFGYNITDITGDGATDASDLQVTENNAQLFLFYARPYSARVMLRRLFSRFKK